MIKAARGIAFGVFDLFHVGHLRYLQYAANLSEYLLVGVRSDSLKTPGKELQVLMPEDQRCELISALSCVDEAFIFHNSLDVTDYWIDWLISCQIGLVVVGGDWEGSARWNHLQPLFEKEQIDVVFAPRTKEISSSMIKRKLRRSIA